MDASLSLSLSLSLSPRSILSLLLRTLFLGLLFFFPNQILVKSDPPVVHAEDWLGVRGVRSTVLGNQ